MTFLSGLFLFWLIASIPATLIALACLIAGSRADGGGA